MAARKPPVVSAGIALLRRGQGGPEVLLVHPGGPYWANKDTHGWSIPKGEHEGESDDVALLATAQREFEEETGHPAPTAEPVPLPEIKLSSSKRLRAFAVAGDLDAEHVVSNTFELEWPPRSGRYQTFPEVDQAAWVGLDEALRKLHKGQAPLVDHLRVVAGTILEPRMP